MIKSLIVFGAGGQLGRGVTEVLINKDFQQIYLVDRKSVETRLLSGRVKYIQAGDLSIEKEVERIFANIESNKDHHFFLFSTIGGFHSSSIENYDYDSWKFMFKLNLDISFLLAKHFIGIVKQFAGGSICFTSALTAGKPEVNKSAYGASKAALNYLSKTLALEGIKNNFTSNIIAPFILDTTENRQWTEDAKKMIKPENIGDILHNLFSNYNLYNGNILEMGGDLFNKSA